MRNWLSSIPSSPARTATFVVLGIAALAATAITLTRYYHAARMAHAEVHLARGEAEAAAGDVPGAIVELRAALALNRHAPDYVLTLATTLLDANRPREAEPYLDEVIAADPTSGPANRARARAAQALGRPDADRYYQRAYFGAWPLEMQPARLAVGFERVEYLLAIGDREQARGMLAQLAADVPRDADQQLRVAQALVRAGAGGEAEPLLRDVIARRPGDAAAWRALARVTFERHEYASAQEAADRWHELTPNDSDAEAIARIAREVRAMDPTAPRLRQRERVTRARRLLAATLDAYNGCRPPDPPPGAEDAPRAEAIRLLAAGGAGDADDLADAAMRLWDLRQRRCPSPAPEADVLARTFAMLAARDAGR